MRRLPPIEETFLDDGQVVTMLRHVQVWAKENCLRPGLIVDPKTHILIALFKQNNDAIEYATVKKMATYSLDMFKLGFWLNSESWPSAEINLWLNFCEHHDIEWGRWWDWEEKINEALKQYDGKLIGLASVQDEREFFVAFNDTQGLTMFKLLFS